MGEVIAEMASLSYSWREAREKILYRHYEGRVCFAAAVSPNPLSYSLKDFLLLVLAIPYPFSQALDEDDRQGHFP